jgi:hypothetical protein
MTMGTIRQYDFSDIKPSSGMQSGGVPPSRFFDIPPERQNEISLDQWQQLTRAKDYGQAMRILRTLPEGWRPPAGITGTTQPMNGESEMWRNLIGSDAPADVEDAIRAMGESQNLSPQQIAQQIAAYRKRHGR